VTPKMKLAVSPECIDMISKMIQVDTRLRWSAAKLLAHPWFDLTLVKKEGTKTFLDDEVIANLQKY
jgi:serine/threonine protein kinase